MEVGMSARRLQALGIVGCAAAFLALAGPASDWNRLRFDPESPRGIVSLELARTSADARLIVRRWSAEGRVEAAIRAVRFDFGLLAAYGVGLALLCLFFSRGGRAG